MKLTPKTIEHLKPRDRRVEIPDSKADGLYLILQPSGHRSWATRYRANGTPTKLTLGSWPKVSLHDARVAAAEALKQVKQGNDPAAARKADKLKAMAAKENTLANICQNYLAIEGKKLRTVDQRVAILNRLVLPELGERPIEEIKRSEIVSLLDKIEARNGARMADVCLAVMRRILHWYETRADDFRSPIIRGMGSRQNTVEHRRTRILDDAELRALWQATTDGTPFASLVRFLLLTSARRSEGAGMCWSELDADGVLWTLPAGRSKTKAAVTRPLSKAALAVLNEQPRISDHVFTSNGVTPIASFSDPKAALDAQSRVTGWTLHDLRRTARSLLSRSGVNSDIAERCLGHSLGDIRERYDRHKYLDEMTHAFEALSALVERIVDPLEGEVTDMAAERKRRRR
jgi:integrase